MQNETFGGDKKVGASILSGPENRFKYWAVPLVPSRVQTDHLTLLTLLWSLVNIGAAFFIKEHPLLLWVVSLMIVLQYISDVIPASLSGAFIWTIFWTIFFSAPWFSWAI